MAFHGLAVPEDPLPSGRGYKLEAKIKASNLKKDKFGEFRLWMVDSPYGEMMLTIKTSTASMVNQLYHLSGSQFILTNFTHN